MNNHPTQQFALHIHDSAFLDRMFDVLMNIPSDAHNADIYWAIRDELASRGYKNYRAMDDPDKLLDEQPAKQPYDPVTKTSLTLDKCKDFLSLLNCYNESNSVAYVKSELRAYIKKIEADEEAVRSLSKRIYHCVSRNLADEIAKEVFERGYKP